MSKGGNILVTGGCGFIGTNLILSLVKEKKNKILNIDKLSYASNQDALNNNEFDNYELKNIDLINYEEIDDVITSFEPDFIFHLAAETHVDRSIDSPDSFISSNIIGTYNLLKSSYKFWKNLSQKKKDHFRLIHVSTDEVYGSLAKDDPSFDELKSYEPNSPYSASKASADHLVRAWYKTYGLPTIITNTCNNYGPYQFPEKLIPLVINKCLREESIPVYGSGKQIRDWIYVEDHISALRTVLHKGKIGEQYNIGSSSELENIEVVKDICSYFEKKQPKTNKYHELIKMVDDRPGHDFRYAINNKKILSLGWRPSVKWTDGLRKTIDWYLANKDNLEKNKLHIYSGERLGKI